MRAIPLRRYSFLASAAIVLVAFADIATAWAFGSDRVLPAFAGDAGAGLFVWAFGHCDGLDGPVVKLARKALDTGNVNFVLPWVGEQDEKEIRGAFDHAVSVRRLGGEAKTLADQHFFETLVRVHRAGEGAPYTGLKPAGRDLGPAIPAADRALEDGAVDRVADLLAEAVRNGVHEQFRTAMQRKEFDANDVRAGRAYVEAYVSYIHYVERLWRGATGEAHGHHAEHPDAAHAAHVH